MTSTAHTPRTTPAFFMQAVIAFGISSAAVAIGIAYLPADRWIRAFLAVGALFLVSSTFTLAKCVRDRQEEDRTVTRLDEARLEKLLVEHDPFAKHPSAAA